MRFKNWLKGAKAKAFVILGSFAMLLGVGASIYSVKAATENEVMETKADTTNATCIVMWAQDQVGWTTGGSHGLYIKFNSVVFEDSFAYKNESLATVISTYDTSTNITTDGNNNYYRTMDWANEDNQNFIWRVPWYIQSFYYNIGQTGTSAICQGQGGSTNWAQASSGEYRKDYIYDSSGIYYSTGTTSGGTATISTTTYSLSFNTNGGSSVSAVTYKQFEATSAPSPSPTKDGYTFSKWTATNSASDDPYSFGSYISTNTILYAQWLANTYTVSFNVNGGNSSAPTSQTVSLNGYATKPANPTHASKYFRYWSLSTSSPSEYVFASTPVTSNIILYAIWNTYRNGIYLIGEGSSFSSDWSLSGAKYMGTAAGSASVKLSFATDDKFKVVEVANDALGTYYGNGDMADDYNEFLTYDGSANISVKYPGKYTISFNSSSEVAVSATFYTVTTKKAHENVADGDTIATTKFAEDGVYTVPSLPSNEFGYSRASTWNTEANGEGTSYAVSATITMMGNITLYARYTALSTTTFYVDFGPVISTWGSGNPTVYAEDSNGVSTGSNIVCSLVGGSVYGSTLYSFSLPENTSLFVIGNTTSTWTCKTTNISYDDDYADQVFVITAATGSSDSGANLYSGSWYSRTLTFTAHDDNTTTEYSFYSGVAFSLPSPAGKSGYTATSWNSNSGGTGDSYTLGQSLTLTADITLYVIYTQYGYYVVGDSTFTGDATPTWSELTGIRLSGSTSGTDHAAGTSIHIPGSAKFRIKNYSTGAADQWCPWGDGGYPTDLFTLVGNDLQNRSSSEVIIDIYVNSSDQVYIVDETAIETAGYFYYSSNTVASSITLTATNGNNTTINGHLSDVAQLATAPSTLAFASSTYLYKIPVYNLRGVYTYAKVTSITINSVTVSLTGITQEDSKEYYISGTSLVEDSGTAARIAWDLDASINDPEKTYKSLCALDSSTLTKFKSDYVALTDSTAKSLLNAATINTYTPDGNSYDKTTGPKITTKTNVTIEAIYNYVNAHYNASTGSWTLNIVGPAGQVESSPLTLTLWIVLGAGILGMGAIGTAYFVSKKKKKGDRAAS